MALPIGLMFFSFPTGRARALGRFSAATAFSAIAAFSPVWFRYGSGFLTFYENHARPDWSTIVVRGTIEIWGAFGLLALAIAIGDLLFGGGRARLTSRWIVAALLATVAIYAAAYLRLPEQAGYLLPIVPAVLLVLLLFVSRRAVQVMVALFLLAPLVDLTKNGAGPGVIFADRNERLQTMAGIRNFLLFAETIPGRNTFVVGAWEPQIAVLAPHLLAGRNRYAYLLNAADIRAGYEDGRSLYYLPAIRQFNYLVTGVDLAQYGARDLRALRDQLNTASHASP
ncbi:MAG: hypothetical protein ABJB69_09350 [Spartobacteria bacterium]